MYLVYAPALSQAGRQSFLVSVVLRLTEVGRFETPKSNDHYQPGQVGTSLITCARECLLSPPCISLQFFLHRVFGYRGVVLFPWMAQVYDRDLLTSNSKYTIVHCTVHIQHIVCVSHVHVLCTTSPMIFTCACRLQCNQLTCGDVLPYPYPLSPLPFRPLASRPCLHVVM